MGHLDEDDDDGGFDFTAPVKSFLERSKKQVQHYFSGTQDPVESRYSAAVNEGGSGSRGEGTFFLP